jgi:predicted P-loop ATPase
MADHVDPTLRLSLEPLVSRVRKDVHWIRGQTGPSMLRMPLTETILARHLNGGPPCGAAPMLSGTSTTLTALLDLDSHQGESSWDQMVEAAVQLIGALNARGLRAIPFRSTGGRGIHLYMVWGSPQDAYTVRATLREALGLCGFHDGAGGVCKKQVEIFPKQDELEERGAGSFGNMFILPLAGNSVPLLGPGLTVGDKTDAPKDWPASDPLPRRERPPARRERVKRLTTPEDLERISSALDAIPNSGDKELDYDTWFKLMAAVQNVAGDGDAAYLLFSRMSARSGRHDDTVTERKWGSVRPKDRNPAGEGSIFTIARQYGWRPPFAAALSDLPDLPDLPDSAPAVGDGSAPLVFDTRRDGKKLATLKNLTTALGSAEYVGARLGYDEFRHMEMIAFEPGQWEPITDNHIVALRLGLERCGFAPINRELIRDSLLLVCDQRRFDSANEWLTSLRWDGTPRVGGFMHDYFGSEDTAYATAVGRYAWTAMAGRILSPGCQADMIPILLSEQGMHKTKMIRALVPADEFFTPIGFDTHDKDQARKLMGKMIAEAAELQGMKTRALESIKEFVTRVVEEWVPKYKERTTYYRRRVFIWASTNEEEMLVDPTGNRRWLPIRVGRGNLSRLMADRDQLWAEAAHMWHAHGVLWREAETLAAPLLEEFVVSDAWEEPILAWLDTVGPDGVRPKDAPFVTTSQVLTAALGVPISRVKRGDEMRIGTFLRKHGWKHKKLRVGSHTLWVYVTC